MLRLGGLGGNRGSCFSKGAGTDEGLTRRVTAELRCPWMGDSAATCVENPDFLHAGVSESSLCFSLDLRFIICSVGPDLGQYCLVFVQPHGGHEGGGSNGHSLLGFVG